jgi:hypothetical protein
MFINSLCSLAHLPVLPEPATGVDSNCVEKLSVGEGFIGLNQAAGKEAKSSIIVKELI